jgi:hypothetical protein
MDAVHAFPDPALTASIYCSGRLDAVIFQAVVPFWRELRPRDPERRCHLWLMRYDKGGEHLKIRVHGPETWGAWARERLEEKVSAFLATLEPAAEPATPRDGREKAPPIDAEDAAEAHPDPSLLWTTYRRSHVSLGGKPFLGDDRYAHLLTRCLASGCERVLALEPGAGGLLPHSLRQSALIRALLSGLSALGFSASKRAGYLAYHRDWLLRAALPMDQRLERAPLEQIHGRFDAQVSRMERSLSPLRRMVEGEWNGDGEERSGGGPDDPDDPDTVWRRSLAGLLAYVSPLCRDPGYHLDPFADDPVFAPVFKVFHGFANQLGLKRADEAFAHHLLLHIAARPEAAR